MVGEINVNFANYITEYIVSPAEPLTIIPKALDSFSAAPLLCGKGSNSIYG